MQSQSTLDLQTIERSIIETIKVLTPFRIHQLLDFAQWLQTQPPREEVDLQSINLIELEEEERQWEEAYMANQSEFRAMAQQALKEFDAGETTEMIIENGMIKSQ